MRINGNYYFVRERERERVRGNQIKACVLSWQIDSLGIQENGIPYGQLFHFPHFYIFSLVNYLLITPAIFMCSSTYEILDLKNNILLLFFKFNIWTFNKFY